MKAQTRRGAAIETGVNLIVGFALTWLANKWIMPWWGFHPPASALWTLGGIMTILSIARQYSLRRMFEWARLRSAPPAFLYIAEELAAERLRQINAEGYDLAHDDNYLAGELQRAAAWYALASVSHDFDPLHRPQCIDIGFHDDTYGWPWADEYWKPTDERRDLEKAGALIIAAIGVIDRRRKRAALGTVSDALVETAANDRARA